MGARQLGLDQAAWGEHGLGLGAHHYRALHGQLNAFNARSHHAAPWLRTTWLLGGRPSRPSLVGQLRIVLHQFKLGVAVASVVAIGAADIDVDVLAGIRQDVEPVGAAAAQGVQVGGGCSRVGGCGRGCSKCRTLGRFGTPGVLF